MKNLFKKIALKMLSMSDHESLEHMLEKVIKLAKSKGRDYYSVRCEIEQHRDDESTKRFRIYIDGYSSHEDRSFEDAYMGMSDHVNRVEPKNNTTIV